MRRCLVSILLAVTVLGAAERTVDVKRSTKEKDWKPMPTRLLADLGDLGPDPAPALDEWGGRNDRAAKATGFFHVEREGRRWTLVDPAGHPWISVGSCSVNSMPTDGARAALKERFGDQAGWAAATHQLLKDAGFNTLACWSDGRSFASLNPPLAWTTQFNVIVAFAKKFDLTFQVSGHMGFKDDVLPVLYPEWPAFCDAHIQGIVTPLKDDARLLGHFSDNELPWREDILDRHLKQAANDPARIAAGKWLEERRVKPEAIGAKEREAFFAHYVDAYFRPIAAAIRRHDPNHLYLGSRFHGRDNVREILFRAAGPHLDVVSFNWYHQWNPDLSIPAKWVAWSGKPYLVTEWYAKGMDSGMGNVSGAGWTVKTQADRGAFYQTFTLGLLGDPACLGWHWFKYQDNDPANLKADPSNRDSNKGLVDNRYKPWGDLVQAAAAVNTDVHRLRDRLCPAR